MMTIDWDGLAEQLLTPDQRAVYNGLRPTVSGECAMKMAIKKPAFKPHTFDNDAAALQSHLRWTDGAH